MIAYSEALRLVLQAAEGAELPIERVALGQSLGRVLAEDILARDSNPPFDNSAMDGFAVVAAGCAPGRVLQVQAWVAAGDAETTLARADSGSSVEIMTGATLPQGYDSVIRVEDVEIIERNAEGRPLGIRLSCAVRSGENIRRKGEDFREGQLLAERGQLLSAQHLLTLGAAGAATVAVRRRPRVALIATGNELTAVSETKLPPGAIRNSSAVFLKGVFGASGMDVLDLGIVKDTEPERLVELIRELRGEVDVVVTTGAVSMGRHDFIPEAVQELGGERIFHKTAIRPGKPILFAMLGAAPGKSSPLAWFGLPGNPVSTAVGYRFFVQPYLRALMKLPPEAGEKLALSAPLKKPEGLRSFLLGRKSVGRVSVIPEQASHKVTPMLGADCWLSLPEQPGLVESGTGVEVFPFTGSFEGGGKS